MADFVMELECDHCGKGYSVQLHNVRTNAHIFCPLCGLRLKITDDQAIRAHRLLDMLEYSARRNA